MQVACASSSVMPSESSVLEQKQHRTRPSSIMTRTPTVILLYTANEFLNDSDTVAFGRCSKQCLRDLSSYDRKMKFRFDQLTTSDNDPQRLQNRIGRSRIMEFDGSPLIDSIIPLIPSSVIELAGVVIQSNDRNINNNNDTSSSTSNMSIQAQQLQKGNAVLVSQLTTSLPASIIRLSIDRLTVTEKEVNDPLHFLPPQLTWLNLNATIFFEDMSRTLSIELLRFSSTLTHLELIDCPFSETLSSLKFPPSLVSLSISFTSRLQPNQKRKQQAKMIHFPQLAEGLELIQIGGWLPAPIEVDLPQSITSVEIPIVTHKFVQQWSGSKLPSLRSIDIRDRSVLSFDDLRFPDSLLSLKLPECCSHPLNETWPRPLTLPPSLTVLDCSRVRGSQRSLLPPVLPPSLTQLLLQPACWYGGPDDFAFTLPDRMREFTLPMNFAGSFASLHLPSQLVKLELRLTNLLGPLTDADLELADAELKYMNQSQVDDTLKFAKRIMNGSRSLNSIQWPLTLVELIWVPISYSGTPQPRPAFELINNWPPQLHTLSLISSQDSWPFLKHWNPPITLTSLSIGRLGPECQLDQVRFPPHLQRFIITHNDYQPFAQDRSRDSLIAWPSSLTHLAFDGTFSQPLLPQSLPPSLKSLSIGAIGSHNDRRCNGWYDPVKSSLNLPPQLESLVLGEFAQSLPALFEILPSTLKSLTIQSGKELIKELMKGCYQSKEDESEDEDGLSSAAAARSSMAPHLSVPSCCVHLPSSLLQLTLQREVAQEISSFIQPLLNERPKCALLYTSVRSVY